MKTLRLTDLPDRSLTTPVVTWGVFDGVHVAHKKVLHQVVQEARRRKVSSVVITFDRHPQEVLRNQLVPLITTLRDRLALIEAEGIDACIVIEFTREFAKTTAQQFIRDVIKGRLEASFVVLGYDSRFGKDREGDFEMLEKLSRDLGIGVKRCDVELFEGRPVGSSLIRELVAQGRLEEANRLLGRAYRITGKVVPGDARGKAIGIPTANVEPDQKLWPGFGVYAAECVLNAQRYKSVVNIGRRPTFANTMQAPTFEVHLIDYAGPDFYGERLCVDLQYRIRDEKKFAGVDDLVRQIREDIQRAKQ